MRLKTSPTFVIECGYGLENSTDICLTGTELACSYFPELRNGPCSNNNSFYRVFGFDCKFYYKLEKYSKGKLLDTEIGIGHIEQSGDLIFLKRDRPIIYKHDDGPICPVTMPVHAFSCFNDNEYVIVQSHQPYSIPELLIDPFSIIVSTSNNPASTVQLNENSILGRLEEDVQSISLSNIKDYTIKSICDYTKQLILLCSQLDIKKLKTKILQLVPQKPTQAKKGSIIYNEEHDTIQYFDGSRWRTLLWRFEDE
ncbi:hypothetical protein EBZ38_06860 [bacterium]|nr:hypothetical protein [bacterium]